MNTKETPFIVTDTEQDRDATRSRVFLERDKREYGQNDTIAVTVTNDLDLGITTFDQQTFCSILKLERQIDGEWKDVEKGCFSTVPSTDMTIEPHTELIVKLRSPSTGLLPSGTYRASLVFTVGESFNFGKSFVAASPPFRVH